MHERFMQMALEVAARGAGWTSPNPMVGAVLVHNGNVISEGFHERFGGPHAEVHAIQKVKDPSLLKQATLYVNLEPCNHFGKTPPCTELIQRSGIPQVVIGCLDPNPKITGGGVEALKKSGIEVIIGIEEGLCRNLNKRFFTYHQKKRPYTILKWAQTSDGFIARSDGTSKWISSETSRELTHSWRAQESAIMVGTKTALIDNPHLTARLTGAHQPLRIALDKDLTIPTTHHLYTEKVPTLIIHHSSVYPKNSLVEFSGIDFKKDILEQLMTLFFQRELLSLFVEGGATLLNTFLTSDRWDEIRVFTSPQTLNAGLQAPHIPKQALLFKESQIGSDTLRIFLRGEL